MTLRSCAGTRKKVFRFLNHFSTIESGRWCCSPYVSKLSLRYRVDPCVANVLGKDFPGRTALSGDREQQKMQLAGAPFRPAGE